MARINPALREPTFEAVRLHEPIGPVHVVADEHYLRQGAFALDDYSAWYFTGLPNGGGRVVPGAIVARDLVALFCSVYDPSRVVGLHQKEEVWFHGAIPLGTTMTYTGRYIDKFERRGKGYVVLECAARDAADGRLLVRQISTEIMRIPQNVRLGEGSARPAEGERVEPNWPAGRMPVAEARADLPAGTPIPPLSKTAYQDQMSVFSGAGTQWYNIHTDIEVALAAGFRDTLAQGMMETCWMSEMLAAFFGPGWLTSGHIRMVYLRPVYRGDTITCRAVVRGGAPDAGGMRLHLSVWAENQDGVMTAAGWAGALVG